MSSVKQGPKAGGLLPTLLELALSFGGYYLLRALGVGIFWALTVPGIAVAIVAVTTTLRRRRLDMIGLLVLIEVTATVGLTLATQDARIAAIREPVYILIAGVFCLTTLFRAQPMSHVSTASIATFGDPRRATAFELAWRDHPKYRMWQRSMTGAFGAIMVVTALIRAQILYSASPNGLAHAIDVSNVISIVMFPALFVVSGILIQPARRIVLRLVEQLTENSTAASS